MTKISIITPCFNEQDNIVDCANSIKQIMKSQLPKYKYEHIFTDNNSNDRTVEYLKLMARKDKRIKILVNSRNVGPFQNMWNALKYASGDAVIPMFPADMQDPPEIIPKFVKNWESGDLVVYGVRQNRQESMFLRLCRNLYYQIISKMAAVKIHAHSGEFLLADIKVIKSIIDIDDAYPYIRGLIAKTQVKSSTISYDWQRRKKGKSRNSIYDLFDQAINGLVSTSRKPARYVIFMGILISLFGLIYAASTIIQVVINRHSTPIGIPSLLVGVFLIGGFQLTCMGILGEYLLSVHAQVRRDPKMFLIESINFSNRNQGRIK